MLIVVNCLTVENTVRLLCWRQTTPLEVDGPEHVCLRALVGRAAARAPNWARLVGRTHSWPGAVEHEGCVRFALSLFSAQRAQNVRKKWKTNATSSLRRLSAISERISSEKRLFSKVDEGKKERKVAQNGSQRRCQCLCCCCCCCSVDVFRFFCIFVFSD